MIKKLYSRPLLQGLMLSLLPYCLPAQAEVDTRDYYVVELSIFTNEQAANKTEENWPDNPELTVPDTLLFPANVSIEQVYPELQALLNPGASSVLPVTSSSPFLPLLDTTYQEHSRAASRIQRSGKHRLLSHQSWLQKLTDEQNAPSIAILAGEQREGFYEIAGSIKLFRSRYLHLHTNLWRIIFDNSTTDADDSDTPASSVNAVLPVIMAPSIAAPEEALLTPEQASAQVTEEANMQQLANLMDSDLLPQQPPIAVIAPMQQKRRMRSREIHYLDHPLFGLIIEIRPLEIPDSEQP